MKALSISAQDRRAALMGVVALVSILAAGKGVPAWRRWDAAVQQRVEHARRSRAGREHGEERLAELSATLLAERRQLAALEAVFIPGDNPAEAAASLATGITALATSLGIRVTSTQLRPDTGFASGVATVQMRLSGSGDVRGITGLLRDVEAGVPLVRIRDLTITQSEPAASPEQPETLRFEIGIDALALDPRFRQ